MMKKCPFSQVEFAGSALSVESLPILKSAKGSPLPEIALIGRSNVGKSSLINHLLKRKGLAHVSTKPGKTRTLNFFTIDQQVALVDLPGYGYAKTSGDLRQQWAGAIDTYLNHRQQLKLILFLMDCRREPTEDDLAFAKWVSHRQIPLLIVFTKSDKLTEHEQHIHALHCLNYFSGYFPKTSLHFLHYSIKDAKSRGELIDQINAVLTSSSIQPE
jgi:GTP-binding protein